MIISQSVVEEPGTSAKKHRCGQGGYPVLCTSGATTSFSAENGGGTE
jgi:hypothetical protein